MLNAKQAQQLTTDSYTSFKQLIESIIIEQTRVGKHSILFDLYETQLTYLNTTSNSQLIDYNPTYLMNLNDEMKELGYTTELVKSDEDDHWTITW
jgi:hypothetical protein